MPVQYVTNPATGKVEPKGSLGFGQPVVPERPPQPRRKPKPKPNKGKAWWGFGPQGFSLNKLANDLRYEAKQLVTDPLKSAERFAKTTMEGTVPGIAFFQGTLGASQTAANAVRAGIEIKQRAQGRKQTDYTTSPAGRAVDRVIDHVYRSAGATPPSQMTPEQKGVDDLRSAMTLGLAGGVALQAGLKALGGVRFVGPGAQALANAMDPTRAQTITGGLARIAFDAAASEAVTTPFDYTATGGSAAGLVDMVLGTKIDPVKPGMAFPDAAAAAFVPNVALGMGMGGLFMGINRARRGRRIVQQTVEQPRSELEAAGLTQSDPETGAAAFTPDALSQDSPLKQANAYLEEKYGIKPQEPEADPAPEPQIPSQPMEPGGAVTAGELPTADPALDPWAIDYDPTLPEADVALSQIKNASDDELLEAVRSGKPVLEALDEQMAQRQPLEPDPALGIDLSGAPTERLAPPVTPFAQQWQRIGQRDPQQLLNVLHPDVNPALAERAQAMFGKEWEELTPADAVETLQAAANEGVTVIPNRLTPGQQLMSTGDLKVDPERFQYKGGTDARGVQRGSSLEGVDRWNTDMEGVIEVWQDAADGNYYVVNGHNRFAKAKELGIPTLPVKELIAESPEQAKTAGALSNIASGGGRPIDAAWFMKGAGVTDPAQLEAMGVPLNSGHGLAGFQLSQLPDDILRAVESGQIKERMGRIIGGSGASEESMRGAYRYLVENPDTTEGRLRNMLEMSRQMTGEAQAAGGVGEQTDLLKGTDWDQTFNKQMIAVADLADEVGTLLKREKRLFKMADANSAALEAKGSRIDKASAQAVADANARAIDFFQRTWMETGPIRDLLNEGGARVANGENKGAVAKQIKNRLVSQLGDLMGEEAVTRADVVQEDLLSQVDQAMADYSASIDKGLEMSRQLLDATQGLEDGARELGDQAAVIKELEDAPLDRLDPIDREAMEFFAVQRAIQNGELRPPETPIPDLPADSGVDLMKVQRDLAENTISDDVVQAMADELDLRAAQKEVDDAMAQEAEKAAREATGYDLLTFDEKKAAGAVDGFADPPPARRQFSFPADIAKSAPRYGMATVEFASDLDRAAYMLRDPSKKSKGEDRLVAALQQGGHDVQAVRAHGEKVKQALKDALRQKTGSAAAPQKAMKLQVPDQGFGAAATSRAKPASVVPSIDIPAAASRKITARTDESRIEIAAESLMSWAADAGGQPMSIDQARDLVRRKGAILDPDAIPGLDMARAREDKVKGVRNTPATDAVAAAYRQFYEVGSVEMDSIRGWDSFDSSPMDMSPEDAALRREQLLQIVRDVVGDDVTVRLEDDYEIVTIKSEWGGDGKKQGMRKGFYRLTEDLIQINGVTRAASDAEIMPTAYHEAFHRLQYLSLGPKEAKVLDNNWARVKVAIGSNHVSGSKSGAAIAYAESQAVAFQRYAWARRNGQDPIRAMLGGYEPNADRLTKAVTTIISAFDRIFDVFEKLYNLAANGTFDSTRGIYERARSGSLGAEQFAFEVPGGGFDRMEAGPELLGWRRASWDGRPVGTGGKVFEPKGQARSEGLFVDELTQALDDTDPKTGFPRGLSRAAVKEAIQGRPGRALAEGVQLAEARLVDLNSRIEAVKQRAAKEGC